MSTSECSPRKRVIIGISGASGFLYGVQALRYLRQLHVESHVVISPAAHLTRSLETTLSEDDVHKLAAVTGVCRQPGRPKGPGWVTQ